MTKDLDMWCEYDVSSALNLSQIPTFVFNGVLADRAMDLSMIRFGADYPPLESWEELLWEVGECQTVEFFPNSLVPLIAIDSPDFETRLLALDDSQPIALDLKSEDEIRKLWGRAGR
jgi:hypothetical protein